MGSGGAHDVGAVPRPFMQTYVTAHSFWFGALRHCPTPASAPRACLPLRFPKRSDPWQLRKLLDDAPLPLSDTPRSPGGDIADQMAQLTVGTRTPGAPGTSGKSPRQQSQLNPGDQTQQQQPNHIFFTPGGAGKNASRNRSGGKDKRDGGGGGGGNRGLNIREEGSPARPPQQQGFVTSPYVTMATAVLLICVQSPTLLASPPVFYKKFCFAGPFAHKPIFGRSASNVPSLWRLNPRYFSVEERPKVSLADYVQQEKVGKGTFATCYRAVYVNTASDRLLCLWLRHQPPPRAPLVPRAFGSGPPRACRTICPVAVPTLCGRMGALPRCAACGVG